MPKINKDQKDTLQSLVPPMVGDIDPVQHLKNMEVVNKVRDQIENGHVFVSKDAAGIKREVDVLFAAAQAEVMMEEQPIDKPNETL